MAYEELFLQDHNTTKVVCKSCRAVIDRSAVIEADNCYVCPNCGAKTAVIVKEAPAKKSEKSKRKKK